jgi:CelD/BcsL family acetyltransferase involved in cellulose biosynthesis
MPAPRLSAMGAKDALLDGALPPDAAWPQLPEDVDALPVQTPAWVRARASVLEPMQQWHCLGLQQDGALTAMAPLVREGGWLHEPPAMYEPSDWLWRSADELQQLAEQVIAQGLPLRLARLPADSPTLQALRRAIAGRGRLLLRPAMPTPFIALHGPADELFNARRRADFRRYERRAAAQGALSYELHTPAPGAELQLRLAEALLVESRSWKVRTGTALTSDAQQGEFFQRYAAAAAEAGHLRIALLRLGSRPVAMQIAAEWRERFWLFKIAHDEALADCSPGQLLMRHTLQLAAARGLRSYEFMGVMDDWTRLWTTQTRQYVEVFALPYTLASLRALSRSAARKLYRRLRRR